MRGPVCLSQAFNFNMKKGCGRELAKQKRQRWTTGLITKDVVYTLDPCPCCECTPDVLSAWPTLAQGVGGGGGRSIWEILISGFCVTGPRLQHSQRTHQNQGHSTAKGRLTRSRQGGPKQAARGSTPCQWGLPQAGFFWGGGLCGGVLVLGFRVDGVGGGGSRRLWSLGRGLRWCWLGRSYLWSCWWVGVYWKTPPPTTTTKS